MKAITPIIATIMLLLVTISVVGVALVFFGRSTEQAGSEASRAVGQQLTQLGTDFKIDYTSGNKVYIRNTGSVEIPNTTLAFYANGQPVSAVSQAASIKPDQIVEFTVNLPPGTYTIKVTAGSVKESSANTFVGATTTTIATTTTTIVTTTTTATTSTTTTLATTTTTLPLCTLTSASITNCAGGTCESGEAVSMSATFTGACTTGASIYFQIDAKSTDTICDIQFTGGDMSGITQQNPIISGTTYSGTWTVPTVSADCQDRTAYGWAASIWNGAPGTGTIITTISDVAPADTSPVAGSLIFAPPPTTTTTSTTTTTTTTSTTTTTTTTSSTTTTTTCVTCYADNDGDTYGAGAVLKCCGGIPAGRSSNNQDCYDANANAKPGQTQYFSANRGDGSFDYNCDGSIAYEFPNCTCTDTTTVSNYFNNPPCVLLNPSVPHCSSTSRTNVACGGANACSTSTSLFRDSACTLQYISSNTQRCR